MPFFWWKGIDLSGTIKKGKIHSSSHEQLEALLLDNDIALLRAKQQKAASLLRPISTTIIVNFFRQLSTLVASGIYLDQGIAIIFEQNFHKKFSAILHDIKNDIAHGLPLFSALQKFPDVFDSISIQLIKAGEQSGAIAKALAVLADYHESRAEFRKQLRSAAFLPCITFLFFTIICCVIFITIVPMFSSMFNSLGKELPASTKRLETISLFLRSNTLIITVMMSVFIVVGCKRFISNRLKEKIDYWLLSLPLVGNVVAESKITYFLQSMALLMQGGVPIVQALESSIEPVENLYLRKILCELQEQVDRGEVLSIAMKKYTRFFTSEILAIIRVGEESGALHGMITKAAEVYRAQVKRTLHYIGTVFQPVLMIVLGLLIMALIVSVYIPIFDLSYAIH